MQLSWKWIELLVPITSRIPHILPFVEHTYLQFLNFNIRELSKLIFVQNDLKLCISGENSHTIFMGDKNDQNKGYYSCTPESVR